MGCKIIFCLLLKVKSEYYMLSWDLFELLYGIMDVEMSHTETTKHIRRIIADNHLIKLQRVFLWFHVVSLKDQPVVYVGLIAKIYGMVFIKRCRKHFLHTNKEKIKFVLVP